jgi:PhzF family phenazine biosynthesis protein
MRQWLVDAFAAGPFKGNPAAVVEPLDAWPPDAWMQALAQENNQAETAYLRHTPDRDRFELRWFTPALEVPLCGHATLAGGHVLIAEMGAPTRLTFDTLSGSLTVRATDDGYEMDFPADIPRRIPAPRGLAEALGAAPLEVWAAGYLVAIVENEATVRGLKPDLDKIARLGVEASRGPGNIAVAALADPDAPHDVVSRFFAPGSGIAEDPATGSAHCILSPLFSEKLGRDTLKFHQAYPGRGGDIVAQIMGPRVRLAGRAVTVMDSRLRI